MRLGLAALPREASRSRFPCSRVDRFLCAPHNQAKSRNCSICGKYLFQSIAKQTAPRQAEERKYIRGGTAVQRSSTRGGEKKKTCMGAPWITAEKERERDEGHSSGWGVILVVEHFRESRKQPPNPRSSVRTAPPSKERSRTSSPFPNKLLYHNFSTSTSQLQFRTWKYYVQVA